jgi:hypothetical protein
MVGRGRGWVVREGVGEMTQTLYAHMNKRKNKINKIKFSMMLKVEF